MYDPVDRFISPWALAVKCHDQFRMVASVLVEDKASNRRALVVPASHTAPALQTRQKGSWSSSSDGDV